MTSHILAPQSILGRNKPLVPCRTISEKHIFFDPFFVTLNFVPNLHLIVIINFSIFCAIQRHFRFVRHSRWKNQWDVQLFWNIREKKCKFVDFWAGPHRLESTLPISVLITLAPSTCPPGIKIWNWYILSVLWFKGNDANGAYFPSKIQDICIFFFSPIFSKNFFFIFYLPRLN